MFRVFGTLLLLLLVVATNAETKYRAEVIISTTTCSQGDSLLLEFEQSRCSEIDNAGVFAGRFPDAIQKVYVEIEILDNVNATVNVYIPLTPISDTKCDGAPLLNADLVSGVCTELGIPGILTIFMEIQNITMAGQVVNPTPSGEIVTEGFIAPNIGFEEGFFTNTHCMAPTSDLTVPQADYCYKPPNTDYYYQLNCFVPNSTATEGDLVFSVSNDSLCREQTSYLGLPISFPNSVMVRPGECRDQYVNMSLDADSVLSALEPVRVWSGYCRAQVNCSRIVECGNETSTKATSEQLKSCSKSDNTTEYCLLPIRPQYCDWITTANGTCPTDYRTMTTGEEQLCDIDKPVNEVLCVPSHIPAPVPTPAPKVDDESNIVPIVAAVIVVVFLFIAIVCICKYLNNQNTKKNSDGLEINMVHAE